MRDTWRRFLRHRLAVIGLGVIALLVILAVGARVFSPHDALRQDLPRALARPSADFPRVESVVMRTMDVLLAFPSILLAIAIVAALGPSLPNVMIAVGVRSIPSFARLTRSMVLSIRELEFVQGAPAIRASSFATS